MPLTPEQMERHPFNREGLVEIPEERSHNYVIDVFSHRTGQPNHYVGDMTIEELQDAVVHYHKQLELIYRSLSHSKQVVDQALGLDEL